MACHRWRYPTLALAGVTAALTLAACSSATPAPAPPSGPSSAPAPAQTGAGGQVVIGHAGMLSALVTSGLTPALAPRGITVHSVKGNSLAIADNIKKGTLPADLFGSADANANQLLTTPANGDKVSWYAVIARNAVVLAYSPRSPHRAEFERARQGQEPWYQALEQPGIRLGRDNPDTDPLGYYDLFVAQLAEKTSGRAGLANRLLGPDRNPAQVLNTSSDLLTSGKLDAQFMYLTGAVAAGVPYVAPPPEVNLSDPAHAADYSSASFTTSTGTTFHGGVIYASIAPVNGSAHAAAAVAVLDYLFSPDGQRLIHDQGFLPSPLLVGGDRNAVPERLRQYVQGPYPPG